MRLAFPYFDNAFLHMEIWKKIWSYLTFRKPEPGAPSSFNLSVMHGINKISILMFLAAIVFLIIRAMLR